MDPPQLSREDAIRYWDQRHRAESELRSGGHVGWDSFANEAFYIIRAASILRLIGDRAGGLDPLFTLDAGCGKGHFARLLTRCGLLVDGIDSSPEAIAYCRAQGPGQFEVSTLAEFRNPFLYDVVYAIDVFFHILGDQDWTDSLVNLASLVRLTGRLIVADEAKQRRMAGNYIVHRPLEAYVSVLEPLGFTFGGFTPYDFRENAVGLLAFSRFR